MTTFTYQPPDNPADPEAAALDLIVRMPAEILTADNPGLAPLTEILQDFTGMLSAESAFTGMAWPDAKQVAAAICFDLMERDDAGRFLRFRARNAVERKDNMPWRDRARVARALTIAANLFDGGEQ